MNTTNHKLLESNVYFENLDALRFFAAIAVFVSHCVFFFQFEFSSHLAQLIHLHFFTNGNLGVNFFFVLSGFLISWLLLKEKEKTGKIKLPNFYMRRVLRIWPVYFIVVCVGFLIGTICNFNFIYNPNFTYKIDLAQIKWYVAFLANFDLIVNTVKSVLLSVLWSVSVEEQFYLFWPLLILITGRKIFPVSCIIVIVFSFIWRIYSIDFYLTYVSSLSVMSDLAFGGLICYYSIYNASFINFINTLSKRTIILVYVLLMLYVPLRGFSHIFGETIYRYYAPFEPLLFSLLFGFVILEQNFAVNSPFKLSRLKFISTAGKISYGIYAYHCFAILITFYISNQLNLSQTSLLHYIFKIVIALVFTLLISYLSYYLVEKKLLKLKDKFSVI